jgi:hypothetical protein
MKNKSISILVLVEISLTFVKSHSKSNDECQQDNIMQMLEFLIDNIFVQFGGRVCPLLIAPSVFCNVYSAIAYRSLLLQHNLHVDGQQVTVKFNNNVYLYRVWISIK